MGTDRSSRFAAASSEIKSGPRISNPVLSAVQFAADTRDFGGATMNVHTNKVAQPGDPLVFVGGEPNNRGERIPTHYVDSGSDNPQLTPKNVIDQKGRVAGQSRGNPVMSLGSWVDSKNKSAGVQVDASGGYRNRRQAEDLVLSRHEDAAWDMKNMRNIRNEGIRKRRKMGPRP